jgi:hypothetical protein
VPSLHDVQRDSVQLNSRSPRHTGILTENDPDPEISPEYLYV